MQQAARLDVLAMHVSCLKENLPEEISEEKSLEEWRQEGKRIEKEVEDRRRGGGEGYGAAAKNRECFSCGEPGHQAKDCGKQQRQRGGRERKAEKRKLYK